ncbi:MAG: cytochrome P450 [Mycobacterium sp.]|jgi:cytochrome P450|nr:MAG: cytochrome P450 [Mycobacterium sp.]
MTATLSGPISVFDADLPTIDYTEATSWDEVHEILAAARRRSPIVMGPHGPELLTYDLVHTALRDPRFAEPKAMGLESQGITSGELWDRATHSLLAMDGDEHHRLRRLVSKAFTPRSVARLRPTIAAVINELVDAVAPTGRCEIVADIARQYPIPVICTLLGAPREDWELFSDWADDFMKLVAWNIVEDEPVVLAAWRHLDEYVDEMIDIRRTTLTDDLISDLIRAEDDGDRLTHDELLMLAAGILVAGTDTTRNQLAATLHVFCEHPEQWSTLAERPDLVHKAVEEALRHSPIGIGLPREAVVDVELDGLTIPAGTQVIANSAAGNRDPRVFDDPDRFDIERDNPATALSFGSGLHYCLGSHLARLELTEALTIMARRMPDLHLDGPAVWKSFLGVTGPATLPVAFEPGY